MGKYTLQVHGLQYTAGAPVSVLHHPPQAGSHGCRRWVFRRNLLQLIGAVHHAVQVQIRSSPVDPNASTIRTTPSARPCRPADESSSSVRSSVPKPISIINVEQPSSTLQQRPNPPIQSSDEWHPPSETHHAAVFVSVRRHPAPASSHPTNGDRSAMPNTTHSSRAGQQSAITAPPHRRPRSISSPDQASVQRTTIQPHDPASAVHHQDPSPHFLQQIYKGQHRSHKEQQQVLEDFSDPPATLARTTKALHQIAPFTAVVRLHKGQQRTHPSDACSSRPSSPATSRPDPAVCHGNPPTTVCPQASSRLNTTPSAGQNPNRL
ncbi:hypothetical protein ACLOJK_021933 [Asimina triloba]